MKTRRINVIRIFLYVMVFIITQLPAYSEKTSAHQLESADENPWAFLEQAPLPSLESHQYDEHFRDIALRENQPNAVMVVAFNRPQYLAKVIQSLEQNPESQTMPFYFFLDGGPRSKQDENIALIDASTIKNKTIIPRTRNYGCPKNHIDSKRFMFDWCGFTTVIIIEDDLVVSPSYINLNLKLHTWAKKNYSNVGIVQCWSHCLLSPEDKLKNLNKVEQSRNEWWNLIGYCLDNEVWQAMRSILYRYELFVNQIPETKDFDLQRSKPGSSFMAQAIHTWIKKIMPQQIPTRQAPDKKIFSSSCGNSIKSLFSYRTITSSQDVLTGFALWMAGYIKIRTVVNRSRHIGEEGITLNKESFDLVFRSIQLDLYTQEDDQIYDFIAS